MAAGKAVKLKTARKTEARLYNVQSRYFCVNILTRGVIIFHKIRKAKQTKWKFNLHDLKEAPSLCLEIRQSTDFK